MKKKFIRKKKIKNNGEKSTGNKVRKKIREKRTGKKVMKKKYGKKNT
jgi:hypothetical protein